MIEKPWLVIANGDDIHVTPMDDDRAHTETRECSCGPKVIPAPDGIDIVVHNSFDFREVFEKDLLVYFTGEEND